MPFKTLRSRGVVCRDGGAAGLTTWSNNFDESSISVPRRSHLYAPKIKKDDIITVFRGQDDEEEAGKIPAKPPQKQQRSRELEEKDEELDGDVSGKVKRKRVSRTKKEKPKEEPPGKSSCRDIEKSKGAPPARRKKASVEMQQSCFDRVLMLLASATWLRSLYVLLFVLSATFAGLLLNDTTNVSFLVLFGVFGSATAFIAVVLGIAAPTTKNSKQFRLDETLRLDKLLQSRRNDGIRYFMLLEAVVDITLAIILIVEAGGNLDADEVEFAAGAIICAVICCALIVVVPNFIIGVDEYEDRVYWRNGCWRCSRSSSSVSEGEDEAIGVGEEEAQGQGCMKKARHIPATLKQQVMQNVQTVNKKLYTPDSVSAFYLPLAVIFNDTADVLLLSRVVFTGTIEAKDYLVFVFLVLNVLITEIAAMFAIRHEEQNPPDEVDAKTEEEKKQKQLERMNRAIQVRQNMRNKAVAQTVITGALVVPVVITSALREFLSVEEVVLIIVPVLVCSLLWTIVFKLAETLDYRICPLTLNDSFRETWPRIFAVAWALVLAFADEVLPSVQTELQMLIFLAYALYGLIPLLVRIGGDLLRHPVVFMRSRRYYASIDRERDMDTNALFRSAAADSIQFYMDRVSYVLPDDGIFTDEGDYNHDQDAKYHEHIRRMIQKRKTHRNVRFVGYCYYENRKEPECALSCLTSLEAEELQETDPSEENTGPLQHVTWLPRIEAIYLDETQVQLQQLRWIACLLVKPVVQKVSRLKELSLRNNSMEAAGAQALGQALETNETLTELNLDYNKVGDIGAQALGEGLAKNQALRTLNLTRNKIGDVGAQALGDGLEENKSLTTLDLSCNQIGDVGGAALGEGLVNNETLETLDLSDNQIGDVGGAALGEGLVNNETLETLDLSGKSLPVQNLKGGQFAIDLSGSEDRDHVDRELEDIDAIVIAHLIAKNDALTDLDLRLNSIGDDGAAAIGEALRTNKTLTKLNITSNPIGVQSAQTFLEALNKNTTLREIDGMEIDELTGQNPTEEVKLSSIRLGDFDAALLAEWIQRNETWETLDLSNNSISDDGAKALGKGLKENNYLTTLKLNDNMIESAGAKALGDALQVNQTLVALDLSRNEVGNDGARALADGLAENKTLRTLDLDYIGIDNIGARALGGGLAENKSLRTLSLKSAHLVGFDDEIDWDDEFPKIGDDGAIALAKALTVNTTLQVLALEDNGIRDEGAEALAGALAQPTCALQELSLGSNHIGPEGAEHLAVALEVNATLQVLGLNSNGIKNVGTEAIGRALAENKALQTLNLSSNEVGNDEARALAEGLAENKTLTVLYLEWNRIGPKGAEHLAEGLAENKTLTVLYLEWNRIGPKGAEHLAEALEVNATLLDLNLTYNEIGDNGAAAVGDALKVNKSLTKLRLGRNEIGDVGAQALGDGLREDKSLTTLDFTDNSIGAAGAKALGEGLAQNTFLTELNLERNRIGPKGAEHLAEALEVNATLLDLNLSSNRISDEGAEALADGLKRNETLKELRLTDNEIGDNGAAAVGDALKVNKSLTKLRLGRNEIGDVGAQALGDGLREDKSLTTLDLANNEIGDIGASALGEALQVDKTLQHLLLDWNKRIGDDGAAALGYGLKKNKTLQTLVLTVYYYNISKGVQRALRASDNRFQF